jgi:hypothetical protein
MSAEEQGAGRKPRRRGAIEESDTPFSSQSLDVRGRAAVRAYLVSLYAMIPFVGLLLAPAALGMGFLALMRGRRAPDFKGTSLCKAAMLLGFLLTITQWGGLTLMLSALRAD